MERSTFAAFGVAAIAIIALVLVVVVRPSGPPPSSHLTVTGTGSVNVAPDTVTISVGVQTNAATVAAAQAKSDATMTRITSAEEALGIPAADLQTQNYNVYQTYGNNNAPNGYSVSENLQITLSGKTSLAGKAVTAATGAGANSIQGLNWSISHPNASMASAYVKALANARATARKLATSLGVTLAGVSSVSVVSSQSPNPVVFGAMSAKAAAAPVSPGTQQVSETLKVVFTFN